MTATVDLQSIPAVLDTLAAWTGAGPLLSVHLDTSPARIAGEGYRIWFRGATGALRDQLAGASHAERERFDAAVALASRALERQFSPAWPGVALYSGGEPGDSLVVSLPAAPRDLVTWDRQPEVGPLLEAVDEAERFAVVLVDKERTRLFSVFLGQIEERQVFVDDVPGKQATGDWFGLSQARYARHHEDHVLRHIKRTVRAVSAELRARPFDRLIVGGPPEARSMLLHHLTRPLRDRLAGTITTELFAPDAEVLAAARAEATAAERRAELAAVRELLEGASAEGVVLGLDATLEALNAGQLHQLFVAGGELVAGAACERCQRLQAGGGTCQVCGGPVEPVPDLAARAATMARAQGARIEHLGGEAADLLRERGGFGAWTRY